MKSEPLYLRTRPADLNLQSSSLDTKYPSLFQSIFMFFSFILVLLLGLLIGLKIDSFNKALYIEDEIFVFGLEVLQDSKIMYYTKNYFDLYQLQSPTFVYGQDMSQNIRNFILEDYLLSLNDFNGELQAKIIDCLSNSLICQESHSYKILRGIVKRAIYDNFNEKNRQL